MKKTDNQLLVIFGANVSFAPPLITPLLAQLVKVNIEPKMIDSDIK